MGRDDLFGFRIGLAIGNDRARSAWKPGNFFGEKFGTGRTR